MPDIHAKLSASGSAKWINCPGSVSLESEFPDKSSEYASEGTLAHSLCELKLNLALGNITKTKYTRDVKKLGEIPADMEDYTEGYKDFVMEKYRAKNSPTIAVEVRLDFSKYVPGGFGTGDAVIATDDEIEVIDFKYGKGVRVDAEENSQLRLYGVGALAEYEYLYEPQKVTYTIYQPRIDNVSVWTESVEDLTEWAENTAAPCAESALKEDAPCIAGRYCDSHFCKARAVCRAYTQMQTELARFDFKRPEKLTPEEIAEVLRQAGSLKKWVEVVEAYAIDEALKGTDFPGWKVVEGKSNRKYADEAAVFTALVQAGYSENDISVKRIKTITDMTKTIGKDDFKTLLEDAGLVIKPQGKPTLTDISDKRPALNSTMAAAEDFKDIQEDI